MNTYHAALSNAINKAYAELMLAVADVPAHQRNYKFFDGTGGKVSIADIIAYQIGWGKLLIGWYQVGLQGMLPKMPGDGFSTWDYDGLAKHFYATYHYDGGALQDAQFCTVVSHIINIVEHEHEAGTLETLGTWQWCTLKSSKQWPLAKWVTVNTVAPYRAACTKVRRWKNL